MTRPESLPVSRDWYRIEAVGEALTLITEPRVRGLLRANAWLVRGRDRDILVDCGPARMRWAVAAGLPVPAVVATCRSGRADWLLTDGLPGRDATVSDLRAEPERLVPLLASGLRRFHQTPAGDCPFRFGPDEAMDDAARRVRAGLVKPEDMHPEHAHLNPVAALAEAARLRPARKPDLVLCHGDYCLPNVLIEAGRVSGFVDLGELAVADRWSDLAVATWSVTWNLGPGWEELFLASYGVSADPQAIAFYRLIYDLAT